MKRLLHLAAYALVLGSVARFRGLFGDEKTALEVARESSACDTMFLSASSFVFWTSSSAA